MSASEDERVLSYLERELADDDDVRDALTAFGGHRTGTWWRDALIVLAAFITVAVVASGDVTSPLGVSIVLIASVAALGVQVGRCEIESEQAVTA